jgi:drug/metabolite transporter (DMT)-like permease
MKINTLTTTGLALMLFAGNSFLCRVALNSGSIDAISFSALRIGSGALILQLLMTWRGKAGPSKRGGNWVSAAMLFLYAICFSIAYATIPIGVGAMILFGSMQLTMMISALRHGERPQRLAWLGHIMALAGFVMLVKPGFAAPDWKSMLLMAAAGAAWGVYTLRGRHGNDPLTETAGNFLHAAPMAALVLLFTADDLQVTTSGVWLAIFSGALGTGLGYVIWYAALKGLTATSASVVQMLVPLLVAVSGAVFLGEQVSSRLFLSGALIVAGISMVCAATFLLRVANRVIADWTMLEDWAELVTRSRSMDSIVMASRR